MSDCAVCGQQIGLFDVTVMLSDTIRCHRACVEEKIASAPSASSVHEEDEDEASGVAELRGAPVCLGLGLVPVQITFT